jgi:hypothetical protein
MTIAHGERPVLPDHGGPFPIEAGWSQIRVFVDFVAPGRTGPPDPVMIDGS